MRKAAPPEIHAPIVPPAEPRLALGIIFAVMATIIFACQDAMTKTLVHNYPATFIVMIRYWVFFLAGAYMVKTAGGGFIQNIKSKRPFIQCLRGLLLLLELIAIALAFRVMGLAEATSIFQSYPLFGTVIAVFLLKEKVGWRRVTALVIGFIGILVMLRPGSGVLSVGAVWALVAAIFFALYMALTRLVGSVDKPQTSFFYVGLVGLIVMNVGLPFFWVHMDSHYIWILVALCFTSVFGHFLMIKALSIAPLTVVQPFNYLQLVWSVIIGYLVFGDMPDGLTLVGAALVVGSGLFVFFREQVSAPRIVVKK